MNRIAEFRDGFRKKYREEQLNKIKNSLRNLLIYCPQITAQNYRCSLCQDDRWLFTKQNINNISSIISTIFHNSQICQNHMDTFMSKILEYIILNPSLFGELIRNSKKETIWIILNKIIVLYQIFGNDSIINNLSVKQYIFYNLQNRNEFIIKLMQCAYFNEQFSAQAQTQESKSFYNINRISFNCLYSIITKNPQLFHSYFNQYPFDYLISNSKDQKLTNIIRCMGQIINKYQKSQEIQLIKIIYLSFKNHLRNVQGNISNYQNFQSYIEIIELILDRLINIDEQMINLIISKIINQFKMINTIYNSIQNIAQMILHKYLHYLTTKNTENLQKILKHCNYLHNKQFKMQIQIDKLSMQLQ